MPGSSLNTQTDREIRYEQRCQQKRVQQQNMERNFRAEKRNNMLISIYIVKKIFFTSKNKIK